MVFAKAKRLLAAAVAAVTVLTAIPAAAATSPTTSPATPVDGTVTNATGTFTTTAAGKAGLATAKSANKVVVPNTVTDANGVKYSIDTVYSNTFKGTKVKRVVLSSNIVKVQKKAFSGDKKLKKVFFRTKKKVTIKKGAFKGLKTKKITVYINKKNKNYKKIVKALRKAGFKGKIRKYTVG